MKKICILLTLAFLALGSCEKADDIFIDEPVSAIEQTPLAVVQPGDIEPIPEPDPCPRHGKRRGKGHTKARGKGHWKAKGKGHS